MIRTFTVPTRGKGLYDITGPVREAVRESGIEEGLCTVYLRHTSASLVIQENADPAVRRDLEAFMERLVPEGDALYTHTEEGDDDMPAHVRSVLTATTLSIPVVGGGPVLGTWQAVYLWEHRRRAHERQVVVHVGE